MRYRILALSNSNEAQRLMHLRGSMSQSNGADASALERENYILALEGYTAHG